MKRVILWLCLSVVIGAVQAQTGRLDLKLPQGHPRYLTTQEGKKETQELIKKAPWAKMCMSGFGNGQINMWTAERTGCPPVC